MAPMILMACFIAHLHWAPTPPAAPGSQGASPWRHRWALGTGPRRGALAAGQDALIGEASAWQGNNKEADMAVKKLAEEDPKAAEKLATKLERIKVKAAKPGR